MTAALRREELRHHEEDGPMMQAHPGTPGQLLHPGVKLVLAQAMRLRPDKAVVPHQEKRIVVYRNEDDTPRDQRALRRDVSPGVPLHDDNDQGRLHEIYHHVALDRHAVTAHIESNLRLADIAHPQEMTLLLAVHDKVHRIVDLPPENVLHVGEMIVHLQDAGAILIHRPGGHDEIARIVGEDQMILDQKAAGVRISAELDVTLIVAKRSRSYSFNLRLHKFSLQVQFTLPNNCTTKCTPSTRSNQ
jgi:hypothetical protein